MTNGKSILLTGAAAFGLMSASGAAVAQDPFYGLYVSGGVGGNFLDDITLTPKPPTSLDPRILDFETGFVGSIALGKMIGEHFRVETEVSYRHNDLDSVTIQNEGPQNINGGDASAFAIMLNGWFDVPVGPGNITPYIGGGIGGAEVSIEADTNVGGPCGGCVGADFDGSEFVFAYQVGAGIAIGAAGGPQMTLDYRYFHADGIDVPWTGFGTGVASSDDYSAHSAIIGFRIPLNRPN